MIKLTKLKLLVLLRGGAGNLKMKDIAMGWVNWLNF